MLKDDIRFRNEYKYLISDFDVIRLKDKIGRFLKVDSHQGHNGYVIRSVYFDDIYDSYYLENLNGVDPRFKFRIRIYNNDYSFIRLEKKIKYKGLTAKKIQVISKEDALLVMNCKKTDKIRLNKNLMDELLLASQISNLMPACVVEYDRYALISMEGNVRITFDTNIRGTTDINSFWKAKSNMISAIQPGMNILEIKFDEYIPDFIVSMIDLNRMRRVSFSKYCCTRERIGKSWF